METSVIMLILNIIVYGVSLGALYGGIKVRLDNLEKKVDLHNHLVERMYKAESRLNMLEKEVEEQ